MKTGCVIINGTDIYTAYGVYVLQGSYANLVGWPDLKDIDKNEWQEANGEEPDLSALYLDARTFSLQFAIRKGHDYDDFCAFLERQHGLVVEARDIGLTFNLRAVSYPSFDYSEDGFVSFSVTFAEDVPNFHGQTTTTPSGSPLAVSARHQFLIEGTNLLNYGVFVQRGTIGSIKKRTDIKEYLTRSSKYADGQTYDQNPALWDAQAGEFVRAATEGATRHESADVVLKCHLSAPTATQCWENYYRLLRALVSLRSSGDKTLRGVKTLAIPDLGIEEDVYYVRQSVTAFYPDAGHYWLDFDLSLRLIRGFVGPLLLAAENGVLVATEDGRYNILIDNT